jgi:hypothetical protein
MGNHHYDGAWLPCRKPQRTTGAVAEVTGKKLGDPKIPNKEIPNSKILRNPRFGIWDLAIGILYGFPTLEFGI